VGRALGPVNGYFGAAGRVSRVARIVGALGERRGADAVGNRLHEDPARDPAGKP
jgi:hypothetical protein